MSRASVPSFSLVELLVVMVLSSIIVGVIYFSYATIVSYQLRLSNQKRLVEDAATLYFILKKDVQQSTCVRAISHETILCERSLGTVNYGFYDGYVLRQQLDRIDTFRLRFEAPKFYQQTKQLGVFPAIVDEIQLTRQATDEASTNISICKYYDAAMLIQLTATDSIQ
jgi:prepilin-type N-terminal cleavage/methylation domain-containing protein